MSWITWVTILVAWPVVGLGVAYLFGRFLHTAEMSGSASDLAPPLVSYLRRKHVKTSSPAASRTKVQREAVGARRSH
jgi:hypothetical protein